MDDLISRREAIDVVCGLDRSFVQYIEDIPSAQPERLTDDDFETIRIHLSAYKEKLCDQHRWGEAKEYQRIIDRFMSFASAQPEITENDVKKYCEKHCLVVVTGDLYREMIKRWSSAQPEIIRCKDCKYSDTFPENADYDMPLKCLGIRYGGVFPDWYCEHAERKQRL